MKTWSLFLLPVVVLFFASSLAGRADEFAQIQNSPNTYWVPAPQGTYAYPPPGYAAAPPPYYYGPPPYYYGPPRVYYGGPRFFIGFRFH